MWNKRDFIFFICVFVYKYDSNQMYKARWISSKIYYMIHTWDQNKTAKPTSLFLHTLQRLEHFQCRSAIDRRLFYTKSLRWECAEAIIKPGIWCLHLHLLLPSLLLNPHHIQSNSTFCSSTHTWFQISLKIKLNFFLTRTL